MTEQNSGEEGTSGEVVPVHQPGEQWAEGCDPEAGGKC